MLSSRKSAFKGLRILITSGPTSVPVDDMRVITNRSTGEMGRLLASAFAGTGASVTILEGAVTTSTALPQGINIRKFYFFNELNKLLKKELACNYDIIIHAAAVSDFSVKAPHKGKISSGHKIRLDLHPTEKLIANIKKLSSESTLIGFKFESDIDKNRILKKTGSLFTESGCDLVILNKNNAHGYAAVIISADKSISKMVHSKKMLTRMLLKKLGL